MTLFTLTMTKNNKFRVTRETSDKNITQKPLHAREKLKQKVQDYVIDVSYCTGKRKSKRKPKNP